MDFTMQVRGVDLMLRFLRHDLAEVPSYGYKLQKPPLPQAANPKALPRSAPEAMGVSSARLKGFLEELDAAADSLGVHSLLILRHGHVICEAHWAPYRGDLPHMLYSMSKSVTATAIGFALDEGLISLDERVLDIFPEKLDEASRPMRQLTVEHLLTMSSGSRFNEVGSMLDEDWVQMFLESVPKFEPGTAFEYNSLNTYMLSAILHRKTGMSLVDYLRPRLFEPLHIEQFTWELCPMGIEKGGWGLSLLPEDSAKLGQLYLQRGLWEGRRLLSEAWVDAATAKQIDTPKGESKEGYGYQMWMLPGGGFQFRGVFGQYVFVLPQYDAVIAMNSGSAPIFDHSGLMDMVDRCFAGASPTPLPTGPAALDPLSAYAAALRFSPSLAEQGLGTDPGAFARIREAVEGREYRFGSNTCGLLPQIIQAVHGNYTMGTDLIRFAWEGERGLRITFYEGYERNAIHILGDGGFSEDSLAMRGERYTVRSRALWALEGDGDISLVILSSFVETPDTRVLYFRFSQNALRVRYDERPRVDEAAAQLFMLRGYSQMGFIKKLAPAARRLPGLDEDSLSELMARFTAPSAEGGLITINDGI